MLKSLNKIFAIIIVVSMLITAGCSSKSQSPANTEAGKRLSVYTSFYTMYDFAKKIGGDKVDLTNLVPAGTEPHDWEPSARDISKLEKADMFIFNGAGMETWVDKILDSISNKNMVAVEASKNIELIKGHHDDGEKQDEHEDEDGEGQYDPHVWLNPMFAKKQMETIKNAFAAADPDNKESYESNFTANAEKLDNLDKEYKDALGKFSGKDIVVAHEAFGYLCKAYSLNQVAIEGLNADSEPTAARMVEISNYAKKNNVKVIFFEELVSPKVAEAIAREIGAKTDMLNPIEGISEEDIKKGREYFSVMRDNLEALKKALE